MQPRAQAIRASPRYLAPFVAAMVLLVLAFAAAGSFSFLAVDASQALRSAPHASSYASLLETRVSLKPSHAGRTAALTPALDFAWGSALQAYRLHAQTPLPSTYVSVSSDIDSPSPDALAGVTVLLVTDEIAGSPLPAGGIGSFFTSLAMLLAQHGANVTVLFTPLTSIAPAAAAAFLARFAARGVRVVGLPPSDVYVVASESCKISYAVLQYLLSTDGQYQVIHFSEYHGLGYWPLIARAQGWALQSVHTVVGMHGSARWAEMLNYQYPTSPDGLLLHWMERRSVELADTVWSPSAYMATYVHAHGWRSREPVVLLPYPLDVGIFDDSPQRTDGSTPRHLEFVFFGRIESRKGPVTFAKAVAEAVRELKATNGSDSFSAQFLVTFLGRSLAGSNIDEQLQALLADVEPVVQVRFLGAMAREAAVDYLKHDGRIAVIPSLVDNSPLVVYECLAARVPILSSNTGGIPELVHPDDAPHVLLPPRASEWKRKILSLVQHKEPVVVARPRERLERNAHRHVVMQREWANTSVAHAGNADMGDVHSFFPVVSVVVTHYERPTLLLQTLAAIAQQTYPSRQLELIVVDDGSPSASVQLAISESVEPVVQSMHGRLLRIANGYLGAARNAGAAIATGRYLLFLDDDDIPVPDHVAVAVAIAQRTGAAAVSSFFNVFSGPAYPDASSVNHMFIFSASSLPLALFDNTVGGANIFVSRTAFDAIEGFTELADVGYEDYEFINRIIAAGYHHEIVPRPLLYVRKMPGKSMLSSMQVQASRLRAITALQNHVGSTQGALDWSDLLLLARHCVDSSSYRPFTIMSDTPAGLVAQGSLGWWYKGVAATVQYIDTTNVTALQEFPPSLRAKFCNATTVHPCVLHRDALTTDAVVWDVNRTHGWQAWRWVDTTTPWPYIDGTAIHPGLRDGEKLLPVRQWRALWQGNLQLQATLNLGSQQCGDGVCVFILLNGTPFLGECNTAGGKSFKRLMQVSRVIPVNIGDEISVLVDPLNNADCDTCYIHQSMTLAM